jgi:GDPmannose 4,6-dehydratase
MKTALILGVTGQDGSYLTRFLLSKGYYVIGVKRRTSLINTDRIDDELEHERFRLIYGNLHDSCSLFRIISETKPHEIYNLAAQSHVKVSFEVPEETVDGIALGTLRLLEAIKTLNPEIRFYQASSSEMYGDNEQTPQNEMTRMSPASPYACAKLFAHTLTKNYRISYGLHASSGILFNHESPLRGETFVTKKISRAAARIKLGLQDKLELGNLNAIRDWGYAGDYVEAMWMMLQQEKPDDYVIATGISHTVKDYLDATFQLAGLNIHNHVIISERLFRPQEVNVLIGDASKAKKVLGWKPKMTFEQLVETMYKFDYDNEKLLHGIV